MVEHPALQKPDEPVYLVYDDDCPVCHTWCTDAFPDERAGVVLVDARKDSALMDEITAAGLDIDQGMVLKVGDTLHYASDAVREATRRSRRGGLVGALNRTFFGSQTLAQMSYPVGRAVRNGLLRVLGIPFIGNLEK